MTTLQIKDIAFGGAGVGLVDGVACFIQGVIDGEKVRGHISKSKARFMEAKLVEVLEASPHRVEAPCPYFLKCGGCAYQHIDYAHQLKIKERQIREALRRIGGIENPPVHPIIASPKPFHYRNRITVHVKGGAPGFFAEKSREVIEIDRCLLASEEINQALQQLRSQRPADGNYRLAENRSLIEFGAGEAVPGASGVQGVSVHEPLEDAHNGMPKSTSAVELYKRSKSYRGFRQVNDEVAKLLLDEVIGLTDSGEVLIDAYCGAGFFAHALRHVFKKIIGIERSRASILLAREEAAENEEFLEGGVEELLPEVLKNHLESNSFLILDPPSEGLSDLVSAAILKNPPQKIIYVSCNPATLARDLKRLSSYYELQEVTPLDMFPQTAEIESVSLLGKRN